MGTSYLIKKPVEDNEPNYTWKSVPGGMDRPFFSNRQLSSLYRLEDPFKTFSGEQDCYIVVVENRKVLCIICHQCLGLESAAEYTKEKIDRIGQDIFWQGKRCNPFAGQPKGAE
jgi:hypothetical protein